MRGIAKTFLFTAILYGILGLLLGLHMGMSKDHGQLPTHAHIMLIGWVSFAIFGFFYWFFGEAVPRWLGFLHCALAQVSLPVMIVALYAIYANQPQYDPLAGIASICYLASFLAFAAAALFGLRSR